MWSTLLCSVHALAVVPSSLPTDLISVRPRSLARLELPVYGSDLVLALEECSPAGDSLQLLLDFSDGELLEQLVTGRLKRGMALAPRVLARKSFFEAARGRALPLLELWQLVNAGQTLPELELAHVRDSGLRPLRCELGGAGRPRRLRDAVDGKLTGGEVLQRDMGAFTGAQPSGVRSLGSLPARLVCSAGTGYEARLVSLPLEGPAEAAALCRCGELPLAVPAQVWAARAMPEGGAVAAEKATVIAEGELLSGGFAW